MLLLLSHKLNNNKKDEVKYFLRNIDFYSLNIHRFVLYFLFFVMEESYN